MKLVYIPGLGSKPYSPIAERLAADLNLDLVYTGYHDITRSPGWTRRVMDHVASQIPKENHVLMGHSFGALLSLYLQNSYTRALLLLAPALGLNIGVKLTIQAELMKKGFFYFEADVPVEMDRTDVSTFFRLMRDAPLPRRPFVIVIGDEDHLVDVNASLRFFRKSRERIGWYVEILRCDHVFAGKEDYVAMLLASFLRGLNY